MFMTLRLEPIAIWLGLLSSRNVVPARYESRALPPQSRVLNLPGLTLQGFFHCYHGLNMTKVLAVQEDELYFKIEYESEEVNRIASKEVFL